MKVQKGLAMYFSWLFPMALSESAFVSLPSEHTPPEMLIFLAWVQKCLKQRILFNGQWISESVWLLIEYFIYTSKCQKLVFADISFYGHIWLRRGPNSSGSSPDPLTKLGPIPTNWLHNSSIKSFKLQTLYNRVSSSYYQSITINTGK